MYVWQLHPVIGLTTVIQAMHLLIIAFYFLLELWNSCNFNVPLLWFLFHASIMTYYFCSWGTQIHLYLNLALGFIFHAWHKWQIIRERIMLCLTSKEQGLLSLTFYLPKYSSSLIQIFWETLSYNYFTHE